jgi:hypothetical protein
VLGIDERFVGRDVQVEIGFIHAAKPAQQRAERRPRSFTTVAMDFAYAITIDQACPFMLSVIDRRVLWLDSMLTAVLVQVDDRPLRCNRFGENAVTGGFVAVHNHPAALFARLPADDMNDRRAVVVIATMPRLLHPEGTRRGGEVDRSGRDGVYFFSRAF